ncbi:dicer-like protein 4 isoform X2 [Olea europaea var. sylvestris]|uniref:dicer-like protein 4 isoform X2 n=1 Tax=Olea europaea var. sylvestris TaxID=158386 RepID=UPI000C1D85AE|nr:dicer-like protein 4 isoform X2 [Olea europaea var. sylvestris]
MTPQTLLHNLSHCFIRIDQVSLLIFDECHYAQLESNHPYAEIMKIFYKADMAKLPRIFGMTASPKLGKGGSIDSLEALLHAKIYSVEDKDELEEFVTSPKVNVYYYDSTENGYSCPQNIYARKLEEMKHQCLSALRMDTADRTLLKNTKKLLQRLHSNLIFCLSNLGLWGALQASNIFLKGDHSERSELVEAEGNCSDDDLCDKYLNQAATMFASDCREDGKETDLSSMELLREPFFSRKLKQLIEILSNFRIVTARSLSYILNKLKFISSWRCNFLVGVHSGLKSMSRKNTNIILEKFRSGEINLLIATKVGEEGLDIQTCCLVIRFDLPETVASFIQSRGRARMPQSEYVFLVDRGNPKELSLIDHFTKDEAQMNEEISSREYKEGFNNVEERTYKVDATGATISSVSSISLLHRYCSKLPHDEYFTPKPQFFCYDEADGKVCKIILPANAGVHQIVSEPQQSTDMAKRDACLKACKELHENGALTDYLLPEQEDKSEDSIQDFSDSDSCDDEESRIEFHEMLVPAALREPWIEMENSTCLSSYYIKFFPNPVDRVYKRFGIFMKSPLPEEAEKMKLDLCLARGRTVMTELIPSGVARLNKDEIALAEKFQQMFLKVILDRSEFIPEYVSLENHDVYESRSSTFYLMLPITQNENKKISVDWMTVKRCLSSPIFKYPGNSAEDKICRLNDYLHLANGCKCKNDVVNSLVYVPCKETFFFIDDVVPEKDGYSLYNESENQMEHYIKRFDIRLSHPRQPLLKAKQLFVLTNLLRKKGYSETREKEEHFIELPPEICQLKIIGFSKDIGSSLYLIPSIIHRLESLLVAIELKDKLYASFPEGAEITANRILEALTTERCCEKFSLERLEVLGDAFLKFAVGIHLFLKNDALDEGQLTRKRSNIVNNSNLLKLATRNNLQVYIRDQSFEPLHFYAYGRPCPVICNKDAEKSIHSRYCSKTNGTDAEVRCNKSHHWLRKKTIADVVEALVGAFIVDSGFKAATAFLKWIGIHVEVSASQLDKVCLASSAFLPLADLIDVSYVENLLGYDFSRKGLLIQAFVHPSYNTHSGGCYQRLEFLGDAVLDYLITSYLYSAYPKLKPGQLTDLRSMCVNNISFADVAGRWSFHKLIICNSKDLRNSMTKYVDSIGVSASGGAQIEEKTSPKALGDLVESYMGAVFLDTGLNLNRVWEIMLSLLDPIIDVSKLRYNPLKELRELCQFYDWKLQFPSSKKDGKYSVEAKVNGNDVSATACATNISRKAAKRIAAQQVFKHLKGKGYKSKSKPLVELLKKCEKKEAKLIGYEDMFSFLTSKFDELKLHEAFEVVKSKVSSLDEMPQINYETYPIPSRQPSFSNKASECNRTLNIQINGSNVDSPSICPSADCNLDSRETGTFHNGSAKSRLYEVCVANCWKPPIFHCCKETGPSHIKEFTFKVGMEIDEMPDEIFEFYGEPQAKKKDAAHSAANGALWYLKHEGFLRCKD